MLAVMPVKSGLRSYGGLPSDIVNMMDIIKILSALQSLKEERAHTEDYLQNAAAKKKELDKEQNASFNSNSIKINIKTNYND